MPDCAHTSAAQEPHNVVTFDLGRCNGPVITGAVVGICYTWKSIRIHRLPHTISKTSFYFVRIFSSHRDDAWLKRETKSEFTQAVALSLSKAALKLSCARVVIFLSE